MEKMDNKELCIPSQFAARSNPHIVLLVLIRQHKSSPAAE